MLENTLYKLKNDKKLTIGYYGGSITEGAGASSDATCWRGRTTTWFKENYPDCEIREIQAAIGGTGSSLGIFRCDRDLLAKKPDLVFMEYSVNDGCGDYDEITADSETIVRKIYDSNPYADIIYVHTTTKGLSERIAKGGEYIARTAHSAVMHRYGIPQIDMGEILRDAIVSGDGDWLRLTKDSVHPNDDGYAIYAKAVAEFLSEQLAKAVPERKQFVPPFATVARQLRLRATLDDAVKFLAGGKSEGWEAVEKSLSGRYDHYIEGSAGATLTYEFEGRRIGVYAMLAKDSGDILYRIDGGEEKTCRTWDTYCKSFNRAGGMIFGGELPEGKHTLEIRVADTKADESEGTKVRIGAFMVY